jgi:hypothetical protein
MKIDGGDRHRHAGVGPVVLREDGDCFARQDWPVRIDARFPSRLCVSGPRRNQLLPSPQQTCVRPMSQRWCVVPFVRLDADEKVRNRLQLVGHLHELHRVHVAGEHHEPAGSISRKCRRKRRAQLVELNGVVGCAVVAD